MNTQEKRVHIQKGGSMADLPKASTPAEWALRIATDYYALMSVEEMMFVTADTRETRLGRLLSERLGGLVKALETANLILLQQKLPYSEADAEAMDVIQAALAGIKGDKS